MNIFLVPASHENIKETLMKPVGFERAAEYLGVEKAHTLETALGGRRPFHCFATTEGNRRTFEQMAAGDELLFAETHIKRFTWRGQMKTTFEVDGLGGDLWPQSGNTGIQRSRGDKPWRLFYVVDKLEEIEPDILGLDKRRVLRAFGYKNTRDALGGLRRVPVDIVRKLIASYGTVDEILSDIAKGLL